MQKDFTYLNDLDKMIDSRIRKVPGMEPSQKLIILRGLPASGKSTWAKEFVKSNDNWKRVNKDDLRDMIDGGSWSKDNENAILSIRDLMVKKFLEQGFSVIVDDTNFEDKHIERISDIVLNHSGIVECTLKDFDAPLKELIERDKSRPNPVGAGVIKRMYFKYKHNPTERHPKYVEQNQNLPKAIIVDIDGTIALMNNRGPYDWKKVGQDLVNKPVVDFINECSWGSGEVDVVVMSGRDSVCRKETLGWLDKSGLNYDSLYMRPEKDQRKDVIIKKELYEEYVKDHYNVVAVFDDRNQTVEGWRDLGLLTFQVNEGDF